METPPRIYFDVYFGKSPRLYDLRADSPRGQSRDSSGSQIKRNRSPAHEHDNLEVSGSGENAINCLYKNH